MATTVKILRLLALGVPLSKQEMMEKTGLSQEQVENAMRKLRHGAYMQIEPVRYSINALGFERLSKDAEREERFANSMAAIEARRERIKGRLAIDSKRLGRPPLPADVRIARDMERRRKFIEARRIRNLEKKAQSQEGERVRMAEMAQQTVANAMAARPALDLVWGGAHA